MYVIARQKTLAAYYVDIDPAGKLWVANNWDRPDEGFKSVPDSALSTRFGGNGTVVYFGTAKPVRAPLIEPVQVQKAHRGSAVLGEDRMPERCSECGAEINVALEGKCVVFAAVHLEPIDSARRH